MNIAGTNLSRTRPLASCAVLAALLFQLGACPCGCLEHNAWADMLGWTSDHSEVARTVSEPQDPVLCLQADPHDCTGEPRGQYLDNAESVRARAGGSESPAEYFASLSGSNSSVPNRPGCDFRNACSSWLTLAHALNRTALQVFRL